ncbi:MAG TPA: LPS export ABC transporter periplasmic protein LptC [Burkholderiaceae bacterium]|nr:LPS export ABC transporter periplasmic protein LptC [Burkholderiaceae bacterium]
MGPLVRYLPLTIAALLALGTWWLADQQRRSYEPPAAVSPANPDFIVEYANMSRIGMNGTAETLISSDRLVHYTQNDRSVLTNPRVLQTRTNEPPITITADSGVSLRQAEEVQLTGDVRMTRAATPETPPLEIRTERLTVRPDDDQAFTDAPVRIDQGHSVLTGDGMDFNNSYRTLEVRDRVRASFLPRAKETP